MDKWEIFLVIVEVVALILLVGGPILKLNTTLTKVIDKADALEKSFAETRSSNSKSHERIFSELDEHSHQLNDHETRLQLMEKK